MKSSNENTINKIITDVFSVVFKGLYNFPMNSHLGEV